MQHNCERHTFETSAGVCRSCNGTFCADCLLYPFGPEEAPFCKPCAITAGGIRSTAANPRRILPEEEKPKKRSGGLFGRLRRSAGAPEVDDDEELSPAEIIEREAEEAREMLDAQRLPAATEEEAEEELPPLPNIAPPAASDDEPELTHRTVPDEIAGGLELKAGEAVEAPASPASPSNDDELTAEGARPDAAAPDAPAPPPGTTGDGTPVEPVPVGTAEAGESGEAVPLPEGAPTVGDGLPVADDLPVGDGLPVEDELVAAARFDPPAGVGRSETEREKTLAGAAEARTADGTPLFASTVTGPGARPDELLVPAEPMPADAAATAEPTPTDVTADAERTPERPAPVPVPAGSHVAPANRDYAADTRELLRRIAELRGR